jgi:outer membrane lipoprotein-sorting protein
MLEIAEKFKFKKDHIAPPEIYLNGRNVWTLTSKDYIKVIVANLEERLKKTGDKLISKAITLMVQDYKPELDASEE